MSVTTANRDTALLHPIMRRGAEAVLADCQGAGLPLRIFEAWRSPERQRYLYEQGRTRPGSIVTYAKAWQSYHQYGLAADFVGYVNGGWTWDLPQATWNQLHAFGAAHGLERLGFETPHLQLAGLTSGDLMDGVWPDGGDASWQNNLANAISNWHGDPPAPPMPTEEVQRPSLIPRDANWSQTPTVGSSDWHSKFGGQEWRFDDKGVYLRGDPTTPLRTPGAPITIQAIVDIYGRDIQKAAIDYQIAPELIVMTIATETGFARPWNFTGPRTFRWEALVPVTDVTPPTVGDYSAGPMQTLATTAREVIRKMHLNYPDPFQVALYYPTNPDPAPANHPLYAGPANLDIGTAELKSRWSKTGPDPILVAAAFNAGGLYASTQNSWHLRSHGDHLDRAAKWFGDACFVLASLR
jgi:peptidoglycan LD-endopeptidase CwlK